MKSQKKKIKISALVVLAVSLMFAIFIPVMFQGYSLMVVNISLIYAIITLGISIMLGMGGQLSFGGLAFMGYGAYFVANVCTGRLGFKIPTLLALVLAPIFCAVLAYMIGLILLKLKDTYFTFATIALVQVSFSFFMNYRPLFGGPDGISGIPNLSVGGYELKDNNHWFYFLIGVLVVLAIIVERIRTSAFGRALASVRDNDTAALTLGVDVYKTKVKAFAIAGMLGGFAGALYVMQGNFVASDLFAYNNATQFIIMAMVGGINNTFGSIVGSVLITILPEAFRSLERYLQLFYGLAVILLMVFMPMGLSGMSQQLGKWLRRLIWNPSAKKAGGAKQ
ncbi:branched-chain amino acid ABC transporter permease [Oscillospiraceae bacterium MB08-C2-2]|nr:branched-chain amino acid ABC transporter permease [Oscillospiraceae bacterium MB08-C2-2]